MPVEIDRKFIAHPSVLALCRSGTHFVQGYLYTDEANTIRIRRAGERTLITWKSPRPGACRDEVEFAIEPPDGAVLLAGVPAGGSRRPATGWRMRAPSGMSTCSAGAFRG